MEEEKVQQLAETLKKQGLAASMYEAIDKARRILNTNVQLQDKETENQEGSSKEENILDKKSTLNELMKEVGVEPEEVKAQEQERIADAGNESKEVQEAKEFWEDRERSRIKDETLGSQGAGNLSQDKKGIYEDKGQPEEKVDLTKVFGHKK